MQALAERAALRPLPVFPLAELSLGPAVLADDACLAAGAWPAGAEPANQYYRARYYDPKIGRFISEDPIGFDGGVNFFSYVGNSPVDSTDPSGLIRYRISYARGSWGLPFSGDTWIDFFNVMPNCSQTSCGWSLEFTVVATIMMRVGPGPCSGKASAHEQRHAAAFANDIRAVAERELGPAEAKKYKSSEECYAAAFDAMRRMKHVPQDRGNPDGWRRSQPKIDFVLPCTEG